MEISDPDYSPGRDYLSNGEIEATGKLIGGAVANICRELLERRKADDERKIDLRGFSSETIEEFRRAKEQG